ncbi:MAG TPA: NADH-quinone oxidoreductase subunit J [Candidatus Polarisedimenticolia bacterium]|nr:NADH-quinone oxidoreductase subunit J [Candidatus Polarisedimenticolia bacterium]
MEMILINGVAFVAIFAALMVVFHRNPMVSIIFLIINLVCVALFFLFLQAQFLFAIQLVVYAGAIMVLFLFVVMLLNLRHEEETRPGGRIQWTLALVGGIGLVGLLWRSLRGRLAGPGATLGGFPDRFGNVEEIGRLLFGDYLLAFEASSALLVVAMIGAVILARRNES